MTAMSAEACSCVHKYSTAADAVTDHFCRKLENTPPQLAPYRHWLLADVLPCWIAKAVTQLPLEKAEISETYGKRDSHNASRQFFGESSQDKYDVCADVAAAFQSPAVTDTIKRICGVDLEGSFLRIEYCQDGEGFWLEPHTDIGAKIFTMVLYLTEGPLGETMGTDVYDAERKHFARAPSPFNSAIIFVPANNTWHGFEKRPMPQNRCSLIINYVKPEWRARHELCFPAHPIGKAG